MIKVSQFIKDMKYLEANRVTYYDNSFPGNCGEINGDGSISFDCIGMIKSYINEPGIVYKTSPAGYYVTPGQVIPDWDEWNIINSCSGVSGYFSNIQPGEALYMYGHMGVYVGEFTDSFGVVCNTVECTTGWGHNGVIGSYVDAYGNRFNHKGGIQSCAWELHGKLSKYVDYSDTPQPAPTPTPTPEPVSEGFEYCVMEDIGKNWLPIEDSGYVGLFGSDVDNVCIRAKDGTEIKYCVHTWAGDSSEWYGNAQWLPFVNGYDKNEPENGFAGDNRPIDGLAIKCSKNFYYRVHDRYLGQWLDWVQTKDCDLNDGEYGFAGIIGHPIDGIEISLN